MTEGWGKLRMLPPIETPPKEPTRFSTVPEIASFLRISKMSVYRLIHAGSLPAYQFGRQFRVPTQAVWDYMSGQRVDPANVQAVKPL